jgi:hypothetical protein
MGLVSYCKNAGTIKPVFKNQGKSFTMVQELGEWNDG